MTSPSEDATTSLPFRDQPTLPVVSKTPDETGRIMLPGMGLRANHHVASPSKDYYPLAIDGTWYSIGAAAREIRMMRFMNRITDQPGWEKKVFDKSIVSEWWVEAQAQPAVVFVCDDWKERNDLYMTDKMFDFCIGELKGKAAYFERTGWTVVFDHGGGIVKSDSSVKTALNEKLRECVHKLEEISEDKKDGHRDSGESALDLLDPSLYALFYGRTKALPAETIGLENCLFYMGKGRVVGVGENESDGDTSKLAAAWMNGFNHFDNRLPEFWGSCHWLPSEIKLLGEGVKITSYINNLHPVRHKELYAVLEQLVSTVVPLWEECLSTCGQWRVGRGHANFNDFEVPEEGVLYRIPGRESPDCWVDPWESWEGDEEPDWQDDAFEEWTKSGQFLLWPEPGTPRTQEMLLPRERGAGFEEKFPRGLQVIFKLANILLTPDHPSYAGGEWQVEGALNDMICASAIYYYDCANITDGRIAFRHLIDNFSTACEEGEFCGYEAIMGFGREDPRLQELGQVSTPEGRVLVFPNRFQHKVEPFRLRDATRPGHRKILAMFLVDPHRPILSTANVPPQQGDWYFERLMSLEPFASLPDEVNLLILENLDCRGWKSWEEALEGRRKLMGERWRLNDELLGYVEEHPFNFR